MGRRREGMERSPAFSALAEGSRSMRGGSLQCYSNWSISHFRDTLYLCRQVSSAICHRDAGCMAATVGGRRVAIWSLQVCIVALWFSLCTYTHPNRTLILRARWVTRRYTTTRGTVSGRRSLFSVSSNVLSELVLTRNTRVACID